MARKQNMKFIASKTVAVAGTAEPLVATETLVCSVAIQGMTTNTDFVYIGDATGQEYAIAPTRSLTIHGDALDHGGFAYLDLNSIYIDVAVNGEGVNILVLEGI